MGETKEGPDVRTRKLRVRSGDGAESDATVYQADGLSPFALVILTPAMGVPSRFYAELAAALARQGLLAVAAELRGHGTSSLRPGRGVDFGYRELVACDLPAVIAAARAGAPSLPLLLLGHSIGAHISSLYSGLHPGEAHGLVFVAAGTPYAKAFPFPTRAGLAVLSRLAPLVGGLIGYFPGRTLGLFGNEARRLIREWSDLARRGRFTFEGSDLDLEGTLATLSLPVLALTFEGDTFAPRSALDHLLGKMPRAEVTREHLRAADLGAARVDHFSWAKHAGPVAERVARWALAGLSGVTSPASPPEARASGAPAAG